MVNIETERLLGVAWCGLLGFFIVFVVFLREGGKSDWDTELKRPRMATSLGRIIRQPTAEYASNHAQLSGLSLLLVNANSDLKSHWLATTDPGLQSLILRVLKRYHNAFRKILLCVLNPIKNIRK